MLVPPAWMDCCCCIWRVLELLASCMLAAAKSSSCMRRVLTTCSRTLDRSKVGTCCTTERHGRRVTTADGNRTQSNKVAAFMFVVMRAG